MPTNPATATTERAPQQTTPARPEVTLAKPDTLQQWLGQYQDTFARLLPRTISPVKFTQVLLSAADRDRKLRTCTVQSVIRAAILSAQLGLDCSGATGAAYLVPGFWNSKLGAYEAIFIIGYRGLIDLAHRSGQIASITARMIYSKDQWSMSLGTADEVRHTPTLEANRGDPVAAYGIFWLKGSDRPQVEVMSVPQIEAIRSRSQAKASGPWVTDWEMMARKTVLRRGVRYLPASTEELHRALDTEEAQDTGMAFAGVALPAGLAPDDDGSTEEGAAGTAGEGTAGAPSSKSEELKRRLGQIRSAAPTTEPQPPAEGAPPAGDGTLFPGEPPQ